MNPPEDVLTCLAEIQKDAECSESFLALYVAARRAFLYTMGGLESSAPFDSQVKACRSPDYVWDLSSAYARIARYYREAHHPYGQRMMVFDETPYAEVLRQSWETFYKTEIERLAADTPVVVAILSIIVYMDEAPGNCAQDFLLTLLDWRYDLARHVEPAAGEPDTASLPSCAP